MGRERLDIFSTPTIFLSVAGETCGAGATRALRRGFLAEKYGLEGQHTRREPTCRQYAARRARRLYRDTPSLWYDVGTAAPRDELNVARSSESALASRVAPDCFSWGRRAARQSTSLVSCDTHNPVRTAPFPLTTRIRVPYTLYQSTVV